MFSRAHARLSSARDYVAKHRSLAGLGIGAHDLVLDLGSGQDPHPRANVLCDKYLADNTERANRAEVRVDRPLVVADATDTPFVSGSFDFAFCAHLLEHMTEPARLLDELQRIARGGYIETPSRVYEKVHGWSFHRWFVSVEGDRLVLEAKDRPIYDGDLNAWFRTNLERPTFWRTFIPRLREHDLLTVLVWRGSIAYEIVGRAGDWGDGAADFEAASLEADHPPWQTDDRMTVPQRFKSRTASLLRARSDRRTTGLLDRLECPRCRSALTRRETELLCAGCGARFERRGNVHVLLAPEDEAAQPRDDPAAVADSSS